LKMVVCFPLFVGLEALKNHSPAVTLPSLAGRGGIGMKVSS